MVKDLPKINNNTYNCDNGSNLGVEVREHTSQVKKLGFL